jgi:hypothetical protein
LSTIMSGGQEVGIYSIGVYSSAASPRGYFGQRRSSGSIFYTWSPSTGLSTLVSGGNYVGYLLTRVDPNSGRVFFGSNNGRFFTWHPSTGLSTLVSGRTWPGHTGTAIDSSTGRVFFGESGGSIIWSWHASTGLSTIASLGCNPGAGDDASWHPTPSYRSGNAVDANWNLSSMWGNPNSGRLYFGNHCTGTNGQFYTCASATGLSTIISGLDEPASHGTFGFYPDGERVYFGEAWTSGGDGGFYTYSPATGLSTLVFGSYDSIGAFHNIAVDPTDGRVVWAANRTGSPGMDIWSWTPSGSTSICD